MAISKLSSTLVSDVIGISLKCGEEVCLTNDITFNKSVQIMFNHDESLEVSNTSIITKYVVFDLFFFCTGSTK